MTNEQMLDKLRTLMLRLTRTADAIAAPPHPGVRSDLKAIETELVNLHDPLVTQDPARSSTRPQTSLVDTFVTQVPMSNVHTPAGQNAQSSFPPWPPTPQTPAPDPGKVSDTDHDTDLSHSPKSSPQWHRCPHCGGKHFIGSGLRG